MNASSQDSTGTGAAEAMCGVQRGEGLERGVPDNAAQPEAVCGMQDGAPSICQPGAAKPPDFQRRNRLRRIILALLLSAPVLVAVLYGGGEIAARSGLEYRLFVPWTAYAIAFLVPASGMGVLIAWRLMDHDESSSLSGWTLFLYVVGTACAGLLLLFSLFFSGLGSTEETMLANGCLRIDRSVWLGASTHTYAEPVGLLFRKEIEWGSEQDVSALEAEHGLSFEAAPDGGDGIRRYVPEGYPTLGIRVYVVDGEGVLDDLSYKVASRAFLARYRQLDSAIPYAFNGGGVEEPREGGSADQDNAQRVPAIQSHYEGEFVLLYDAALSEDHFAEVAADLVGAACSDPLFVREVGWLACEREDGMRTALYFGAYAPFAEQGKPFDYYADKAHVKTTLEESGFFTPAG